MNESQTSLAKQLARHTISYDSNLSSSQCDSESEKTFEFLDKILGNTEQKVTKPLLDIFLQRNFKYNINLQLRNANVMEHKFKTDISAKKDTVVQFGKLKSNISSNLNDYTWEIAELAH